MVALILGWLALGLLAAGATAGQTPGLDGTESGAQNRFDLEQRQRLRALMAEPEWQAEQPDYDLYYSTGGALLAPPPNAIPYLSYRFVPAQTFSPQDSDTTFDYAGFGCLQGKTGTDFLAHSLDLPEGSVIEAVRLYFYDDDATGDVLAALTFYDGQGGFNDLAFFASVDSGGYGTTVASVSHTYDSMNNSYVLLASFDGSLGSDVRFCGLRVAYRLPSLVR